MINKLLVIATVALLLNGCAAPFSKFYYDRTGGIDITQAPGVLISEEEPKLFRGNNEEEDSLKMLEDGYDMVGYSSFNAGNVDASGALTQAKKVRAAVVIIYSKYTNTVSGVMPLTLPDTQTSSTLLHGSVYGSGGYATYSGSAYTTTYGTKTTYIPYSVRRSDYMATYWVKLKKLTLGVHLNDLTTEARQEIGSNKGMLVIAVVKGSPAFHADILRGDVVRQIGGTEIYSRESVYNALDKWQGQLVDVVIFRKGKEIRKEIKLNTRF